MLDTETKRRIDTARDILVGKVPDPKSQVEQITIALIYKFMDDMDAEAEELGGKRKFFTGDFARYGWAKLMDRGLGGHEMLALYAEGITKMPENPGIPLLFREIFKNAFLPYRDPETLKAFLKTIDEFSYDHSERLGDAFEYLLSVLGSQGDAGQFRTPRHIIDFMVAVIDPQKTETVLDPACGTAGFLISSYKHILRANTETPLTPDERGRLAQNFKGYDISPDMVRLSLVNLYLHGFTDPHIYEYDTLTSEERWNEYADVILANPPFMSPKGGIKPHKRFSIQAKRSEVLFVDYMAEHLTPAGRAAIIVPEGIIFQSQTAYKDLRRMLVENYLVAVVSLPAGCFNPYSGVKTSILILDKALARQSQTVAFFKVENDGFGLGAQRRAIEKNDLPQVQAELKMYLQGLRAGQFSANSAPPSQQSGQDTHSSRNDDQFSSANSAPPSQQSGQDAHSSRNDDQFSSANGAPPSQQSGQDAHSSRNDDQFSSANGAPPSQQSGQDAHSSRNDDQFSSANGAPPSQQSGQDAHLSRNDDQFSSANGAPLSQPGATPQENAPPDGKGLKARTNANDRSGLQPSGDFPNHEPGAMPQAGMGSAVGAQFISGLIVPKEKIAANGDYNLSGERYREEAASNHQFPQVELGTLCKPEYGFTASAEDKGDARFVRITDIAPDGRIRKDEPKFIKLSRESEPYLLEKGDLLVARTGATYGKTMLFDEEYPAVFASYLIRLRFPKDKLLPEFYWSFAQSEKYWEQAQNLATGGGQPQFNGNALTQIKIPLPPLEVQKEIVAEIEGYQKVINGARAVLDHYRPHIPIHPDWPMVPLDEVCEVRSGGTPSRSEDSYWNGTIPWVGSTVCKDGEVLKAEEFITEAGLNNSAAKVFPIDTTLIALVGATIGKTGLLKFESTTNQNIAGIYPKSREVLEPIYLFHAAQQLYPEFMKLGEGKFRMANLSFVREQKIPLPPLATQQAIVAEIEAEQALVAANRELIARFERKIQATLARIWGEAEPTEREDA